MSSVIPFIEVMRAAETGKPFKVGFCTADYKRKKGGEYLEYDKVILKSLDADTKVKGDGIKKNDSEQADGNEKPLNMRKPNHRQNDTRHLIVPGQARPLKFHPRLMLKFNDMEVLY